MTLYRFIKISNNNNPNTDFTVDITTMKDTRLRISALKSQYKNYLKKRGTWKPIFHYFHNIDYSFCEVHFEELEHYDDAKRKKFELLVWYWNRMNPNDPRKVDDYI
jgi:hypothetical protein